MMKLVTQCCFKKEEQKEIFVSHTIVSYLNRHHLQPNTATYGWKKEEGIWVHVWFEGNALPCVEEITAISLGSVKSDNQEFEIAAENESGIEIARTKNVFCRVMNQELTVTLKFIRYGITGLLNRFMYHII